MYYWILISNLLCHSTIQSLIQRCFSRSKSCSCFVNGSAFTSRCFSSSFVFALSYSRIDLVHFLLPIVALPQISYQYQMSSAQILLISGKMKINVHLVYVIVVTVSNYSIDEFTIIFIKFTVTSCALIRWVCRYLISAMMNYENTNM